MLRQPLILWRTLVFDMLRLVVLCCAALVLVIAMGAAIKPLASGVLQASDVLRFIVLAVPPMLAYALPFAACFGATLAYYRFAADNETTAAYAGGISHRTLLAPAVVVGVLLSLVLGYMNEQVSPRFWREMEKLGQGEIARLLAQEIEKGQPVPLENGRLWVYADSAARVEPPPATGAIDQVRFANLAVLQLDDAGVPTAEATAQHATLWVFPPEYVGLSGELGGGLQAGDASFALGSLELQGVIVADSAGLAGFREAARLDFRIPRFFREKSKYLTFHELSAARRDPGRTPVVATARLRLQRELALHDAMAFVDATLRATGSVKLADDDGGVVTIEARSLATSPESALQLPDGALPFEPVAGVVPRLGAGGGYAPGVRVRMERGGARTVAVGEEGWLQVVPTPSGAFGASIHLRNARVTDADTDLANALLRPVWQRSGVRVGDGVAAQSLVERAPSVADTIAIANSVIERSQGPASRRVQGARAGLLDMQARVLRELTAKRHERFAIAASCLAMVLAGATTALRRSKQLPLTVYLWAFLPAIACLVLVSGGAQVVLASKTPWLGLVMVWSSVGALLMLVLWQLRAIAKH
jgi:lipopolysaccharide export LptBFGC system permease protein LptF